MKTLQPVFAILGFVAATLATTGTASAQQGCVPHETATDQLEKRFNEQVVGRGLANSGKAMF
jgi:hypothetical protein